MRRWLVALLCAYSVAGVFGRFPWKADEPYSFGISWQMLERHAWLVPQVADLPFVEKPPLVYWLGAAAAQALPMIAPHESVRVGVLVLVALAAGGLFAAARSLHAEARRFAQRVLRVPHADRAATVVAVDAARPEAARRDRERVDAQTYGLLALALAAGTVGLSEHVHKLTADLGQFAGAVIAVLGLVDIGCASASDAARSRWSGVRAGALLGTGAGCAFMSKGLLMPGVLAATVACCLPIPAYRSRRAATAFAVAVACALPWLLIWPWLLRNASHDLFDEWLWTQNFGRFLGRVALGGNHVPLARKMLSLAAMSFPAVLLCAATLRSGVAAMRTRPNAPAWRAARDAPAHLCVAIYLAVSVVVLGVSASFRDVYVLPALPAVILLGLPAVAVARADASDAARQAAIAGFGVAAALIVAAWIALIATGDLALPVWLHDRIGGVLPLPFRLAFHWPAAVLCVVAIVAWWRVVRVDSLRSVTLAWCAGFAMLWSVAFSLLLPWIDAARSYRSVFLDVAPVIASAPGCVATLDLGESELAMFDYVTGLHARRSFRGHSGVGDASRPNPAAFGCRWLLELSNRSLRPTRPDPARWEEAWTGSRPADADERFVLYRQLP